MPDGIEIERTWLLSALPDLPPAAAAWRFEQGYLPEPAAGGPPGEIREGRLRRETAPDGTQRCRHTIKRGSGIRREEIECTIPDELFAREWPRTEGARLTKTRYRVREPMSGLEVVWEIDVFDDVDLVLAEVELPRVDVPVTLPAWLADHVVREVTDDPDYRNYAIARRTWLKARD